MKKSHLLGTEEITTIKSRAVALAISFMASLLLPVIPVNVEARTADSIHYSTSGDQATVENVVGGQIIHIVDVGMLNCDQRRGATQER